VTLGIVSGTYPDSEAGSGVSGVLSVVESRSRDRVNSNFINDGGSIEAWFALKS